MLEIIILIVLCKRIGNIAQSKGLAPGRYKAYLVALWFLGEIGGLMAFKLLDASMHIARSQELMVAVVMAVAGAAVGAALAFFVARNAKGVLDENDQFELEAMGAF